MLVLRLVNLTFVFFSVVLKSPFSSGLYPPLVCVPVYCGVEVAMHGQLYYLQRTTDSQFDAYTWLLCPYCGSSVQCTCTWCKHKHHGMCACMHRGWCTWELTYKATRNGMQWATWFREICMERLWDGCQIVAQVSHTQMITSTTLHPCDKQGVYQGMMQHTHVWQHGNAYTIK